MKENGTSDLPRFWCETSGFFWNRFSAFDLEELLGLNVRSDRIVLGSVDDDKSREVDDITSFNWSKFSMFEIREEISLS